MIIYYSLLAFIIGCILGSFSNVCIYRLPLNKQFITGRSYCPKCKKKINWYDNLPLISYINLNRKCRNCKKKISFNYFLVELISGFCALYIFINYNNFYEIIFLQLLVVIFLIIYFIDLKHFIIPDILNLSFIALAFFKNFIPDFESSFTYDLNHSIIGGVIGYLIIWSIIFFYKKLKNIEAMGLGDAKLMAGVGLLFGWYSVFVVLFISAILGLIFTLPDLIKNTKNLKTKIPFGPFIIISTIIYYFYGSFIIKLILL